MPRVKLWALQEAGVREVDSHPIVIAIDAMGGSAAPLVAIQAADLHLERTKDPVHFLFFGPESVLEPLLVARPRLLARSTIVHASDAVQDDDKPTQALRAGKQTSMRLAIDAVQRGDAAAVISAGNTGALMAIGKVVLRMLPMIDRPAIAAIIPTMTGRSVMLDLGANVECSADNLVQFALMGSAFARIALSVPRPSVGLLNIGSEEMKGHESIRSAAAMLRELDLPIDFVGYLEGDEITRGKVDVIVTDGFSGNIALKTAEGTAKFCRHILKESLHSSLAGRIGGWLARRTMLRGFSILDPRRYNGAMLLGLGGIVVKSHGSSDVVAWENAMTVTGALVRQRINEQLSQKMADLVGTDL